MRFLENPYAGLSQKIRFQPPFQETPSFLPGTFRDSVCFEQNHSISYLLGQGHHAKTHNKHTKAVRHLPIGGL